MHITPLGKGFEEADIATRKKIFRESLLKNVTLIQQIRNALERKSDHELQLGFLGHYQSIRVVFDIYSRLF